jgi:S-DNA-T family DNA segregation ATPase FtsK/SpoIIIE
MPMADIDVVITRARALREAAGTITGHAAGDHAATAAEVNGSLLDDILTVVPVTEQKVWSEAVAARLAELRSEVYGGWKPEQVAAALKPFGIPIGRQVWGTDPISGEKANRKGIHRDDIAAAVAERNQRRRAA